MNEITLKQRESNFELLRIVAMLFIVLQHLCQHGFFFVDKTNTNYLIVSSFLGWTGNLGNYLFMLISGYFLCTASFSFKKFFNLWLQIYTTSIIIALVIFLSKLEIYVDPNEYVLSRYTNL